MKLIDKDALVAEIDKIIPQRTYERETLHSEFVRGQRVAYNRVLSVLDTLEVKEVDLDREMQAFALLYLEPLKISDSNIGISITMAQLYSCAKHFFELGLRAQKGE